MAKLTDYSPSPAKPKRAKKRSFWGSLGHVAGEVGSGLLGFLPNTVNAFIPGTVANQAITFQHGHNPMEIGSGILPLHQTGAPAARPAGTSAGTNYAAPQVVHSGPSQFERIANPDENMPPGPGPSPYSSDYIATLRQSQATQQAALEAQWKPIFESIAAREAASRAAAAQLPARYASAFGQSQGALEQVAGTTTAQVNAAGPTPLSSVGLTGQEGFVPFQQALNVLQGERNADVPLVAAGTEQYLGGQRTAAELQKAQAINDLTKYFQGLENDYRTAGLQADERYREQQLQGQQQLALGRQTGGQQLDQLREQARLEQELQQEQQAKTAVGRNIVYGNQLIADGTAAQLQKGPATQQHLAEMKAEFDKYPDPWLGLAAVNAKYSARLPRTTAIFLAQFAPPSGAG